MKQKYLFITILWVTIISCNTKKIGDTTVSYSTVRSEILIDKFPHGIKGIEGFNTITYPQDFSFIELDETVYDFLTSKNFISSETKIKIRYDGKDEYGNDSLGTWLDIGKINTTEAKKFADFVTWNKKYSVYKLLETYSIQSNLNEVKVVNGIVLPETKNNNTLKVTQGINFLQSYIGKYPYEVKFLENNQIKSRLKKLLGVKYSFLIDTWAVETPIDLIDGEFVASACQAHNCSNTNFIITANLDKNLIYVGIREDNNITTYSEDGSVSEQILKWSAE